MDVDLSEEEGETSGGSWDRTEAVKGVQGRCLQVEWRASWRLGHRKTRG